MRRNEEEEEVTMDACCECVGAKRGCQAGERVP